MLFVIASAFLGFVLTRVPFVPTYASDIEFFVKKLGISSSDVFFDLGSGDGKVCFIVNKLTGAKCMGFELTWWTHLLAQIKLKVKSRKSKVEFHRKNFFKSDWSEATIIYAYLYPMIMKRVQDKFKAEMKPGSIAIVRDFPFPDMPYDQKYYLQKKHEIYVYKL